MLKTAKSKLAKSIWKHLTTMGYVSYYVSY